MITSCCSNTRNKDCSNHRKNIMIGSFFGAYSSNNNNRNNKNESISTTEDGEEQSARSTSSRAPFRTRSKRANSPASPTRTKSSSSSSPKNKNKKDDPKDESEKDESNHAPQASFAEDADPLLILSGHRSKSNEDSKKKRDKVQRSNSGGKKMLKFGALKRSDGREPDSPKSHHKKNSKSKSKSTKSSSKTATSEDADVEQANKSPKSSKREKHKNRKKSSKSNKASSHHEHKSNAAETSASDANDDNNVASSQKASHRHHHKSGKHHHHHKTSVPSSACDGSVATKTSLTTTEDEKTVSSSTSPSRRKGVLRTRSMDESFVPSPPQKSSTSTRGSPRASPKSRSVRRHASGSGHKRSRHHHQTTTSSIHQYPSTADHPMPSFLGFSGAASSSTEPPPPPSPMGAVQRFLRRNSLNSNSSNSTSISSGTPGRVPLWSSMEEPASSSSFSLLTPKKRVTFPDDPVTETLESPEEDDDIAPEELHWSKKEIKQMLVRAQKLSQDVAYGTTAAASSASSVANAGGGSDVLNCLRFCYGFGNNNNSSSSNSVLMVRRNSSTGAESSSQQTQQQELSDSSYAGVTNPQQALHYYFHFAVKEQDEFDTPTTLRGLERHICFAIQDYQNQCIQSVLRKQAEIHEDHELWTPQQEQLALYKQSTQASSICRRFARLIAKADSALVGTKHGRSIATASTSR